MPLAPPEAVLRNMDPQLPVEATLLGPEDTLARINLKPLGDPMGAVGPPSNGPGDGSGIGGGHNQGVGSRSGPWAGPDVGCCISGTIYRPGNGVTAPQLTFQVEPEYTDAARKAKYQGTVIFQAVVGADGRIRELRSVRALGMGLDEKAMEAVRQWRFRPGMKDGKPADVVASIKVTFRLL